MEVVRVMGEFKRNFKTLHQVLSAARGAERKWESKEREGRNRTKRKGPRKEGDRRQRKQ